MFLLVQHPFAEGNARGEDLRDAALDEFVLHQRRVFELVADGHLVARADEFLEVSFYGMVREARHRRVPLFAVGAAREHKPEHLAREHGVVGIGLIEVADAVQEYCLGVLRLDAEILLQHRGIFAFLCHGGVETQRYKNN